MKVIPVTEAKARLTHYGRKCRKEQIVVTVSGRPAFKIVAIDDGDDDDLVQRLLKTNARFRKLVETRFKEKRVRIPAEEVLRRI